MNRVLKLTYPILIIAAYFVLSATSLRAQSGNDVSACYPVANASFELFDNRKPLNWTISSWGGSQADYVPSTPGFNSAFAGQIAMQPYVSGTDAKLRSANIAVPGNQPIDISLYAKGDASVVELQIVQYDNQSRVIDYTWLGGVQLGQNASQWQEHSKQFHSAQNTTHVQLEILVKSAGTIYLDNIWAGRGTRSDGCNEPVADVNPQTIDAANGFIFSRTDKNEYRWISAHQAGGVGSIWISESCAKQFNVPVVRGDWIDLLSLAPRFDSIASPCVNGAAVTSNAAQITTSTTGFVFSRTDINEYRWVDLNSDGVFGSRWISEACAMRLGGASALGDWVQLTIRAPAFDSVSTPC